MSAIELTLLVETEEPVSLFVEPDAPLAVTVAEQGNPGRPGPQGRDGAAYLRELLGLVATPEAVEQLREPVPRIDPDGEITAEALNHAAVAVEERSRRVADLLDALRELAIADYPMQNPVALESLVRRVVAETLAESSHAP